MYCKNCGNKIDEDSKFCKICGASLEGSSHLLYKNKQEEPLNLKVDAKIAPSMKWFNNIKLTNLQKNCILAYIIWFFVHLVFLFAGNGSDHFWPHIFKSPNYTEQFYERLNRVGSAPVPEDVWHIKWDLKYYGSEEFIIYVFLVPLIIFAIYKVYLHLKKN